MLAARVLRPLTQLKCTDEVQFLSSPRHGQRVRSMRFGVMQSFLGLGLLAASVAQGAIPATERAVLDSLYTSTNGQGWTSHLGWEGEPGTECTWEGIGCSVPDHVTEIYLLDNHLSGSLPALAGLTRLQYFDVSINQLSGPIPVLNTLTDLVAFDAFANSLSGALPDLSGMVQLAEFDVSINQLGGTIPALTGLSELFYFNVSDNRLSGAVPALTGLTQLHHFFIGGNRLTGVAPDPPAPNNLAPGGSNLCTESVVSGANRLAPTPSDAWNTATATTPWYLTCDTATIFASGFDD